MWAMIIRKDGRVTTDVHITQAKVAAVLGLWAVQPATILFEILPCPCPACTAHSSPAEVALAIAAMRGLVG